MPFFELIIGLLIGAAILTTVSRRIGAPYPVVLAVAGTAFALLPVEALSTRLDPSLALTLFVAPVLLDAAFDTSPRDLRANWVPVFSLVLFCVGVTVAAVALVARWLVPDMPWSVAIALGAIVAPPDATAATSILRLISPPHRVLVILEGESLLNDASALLIYRFAVGIAMGGSLTVWQAVPALVFTAVGGCGLGFALGWLFPKLTRRIDDIPVHIAMQFVGAFGVWIVADRIGVSPILTVVAYAVTIAQNPLDHGAEHRRTSFAVWDVAIYVLNALAFILVGLQLHAILEHINGQGRLFATFSLAVLATVILARIAWVAIYSRGRSIRRRWQTSRRAERGVEEGGTGPSWQASVLVSWCGMRGIVTLATALALPDGSDGGAVFPSRDLLIAAAFTVVLGTLVVQGLTLGPLLRRLDLADDDEVGREERLAREDSARAALAMLDRRDEPEAAPLRSEYKTRLREQATDGTVNGDVINKLRLDAIETERGVLDKLRRNRTIGDDAYRTVEEELDWAEGHAAGRKRGAADVPPDEAG